MRARLTLGFLLLLTSGALSAGSENPFLQAKPAFREARLLIKAEDYAKAIPILKALNDEFPKEPELLNLLGFTHRKMKDYPAAKVFYDGALAIDPFYMPALEYQGMWFVEMGQIPAAKANLEKLKRMCATCEETLDLAEALKKAGH